MLTEPRPFEHRQTEVDGGRVKGVDMTVKLEDFLYPAPAGFRNHEEGELLEDAVVTLLVSFAKIAPSHGPSDSEVINFPGMGLPIATMRSRRLSRFESCPNIIVSN